MRFNVVITPRTFGKVDSTPIDMLKEAVMGEEVNFLLIPQSG